MPQVTSTVTFPQYKLVFILNCPLQHLLPLLFIQLHRLKVRQSLRFNSVSTTSCYTVNDFLPLDLSTGILALKSDLNFRSSEIIWLTIFLVAVLLDENLMQWSLLSPGVTNHVVTCHWDSIYLILSDKPFTCPQTKKQYARRQQIRGMQG